LGVKGGSGVVIFARQNKTLQSNRKARPPLPILRLHIVLGDRQGAQHRDGAVYYNDDGFRVARTLTP
jgi:hypothetical protein